MSSRKKSLRLTKRAVRCLLIVVCCAPILLGTGCARKDYRMWADRDAYCLINSRQFDQRWDIPDRVVEPDIRSRLADGNDPDCGPLPPDDPAANQYMRQPYRSRAIKHWDQFGQLGSVENDSWLSYLPKDENGVIQVDKERTVDLALVHNRDFQGQVESLHLQALGLSQTRFGFDVNWAGGSNGAFSASNGDSTHNLSESNQLGFSRSLAAGGQFVTNLANAFVWQYGSGGGNFASGSLLLSLTQPLLRGAFRHVRTEGLTQAERSLLYAVRDFAHFRREFYLGIVSEYFSLLNQVESLRIERDNLKNLRLNLDEHEELLSRELVSPIQVDQVFQSYQSGRLSLIGSEQALEASLDSFKFTLGLPARVEIELDESFLGQFQLNSPELEKLQEGALEFNQSLMEYLPPPPTDEDATYSVPKEFFEQAYAKHERYTKEVVQLKPKVEAELKKLKDKLGGMKPGPDATEDEQIDFDQQTKLIDRLEGFLTEMDKEIEEMNKAVALAKEELAEPLEEENQVEQLRARWERLQFLIASPRQLQFQISTLFVSQAQIRLFLIEFDPIDVDSQEAVEIALRNRLDLMNARAQVMDARRSVEIAADALESDLSVSASANLNTDPNRRNTLRLDGEENTYNLGVQFDGPLNRMSERNGYRSAQISYQQQRRAYMALEDQITNQIRQDVRQLTTNRFNFIISRQQLIASTRQVDEAQFNLRTGLGDSSLTQDLLSALQGLRGARNGLISSWVNYEISRIRLYVDLELLNLDENGIWINEREDIFGESNARRRQPSQSDDDASRADSNSDSRSGDGDDQRLEQDNGNSGSTDSAESIPELDVDEQPIKRPQPADDPDGYFEGFQNDAGAGG